MSAGQCWCGVARWSRSSTASAPPAERASGSESGAESPQGESGSVRTGLEQALLATETMVEGVSRAGIPDTPNGQGAADGLSGWADGAVDEIERAQDALGEETDSTSC